MDLERAIKTEIDRHSELRGQIKYPEELLQEIYSAVIRCLSESSESDNSEELSGDIEFIPEPGLLTRISP